LFASFITTFKGSLLATFDCKLSFLKVSGYFTHSNAQHLNVPMSWNMLLKRRKKNFLSIHLFIDGISIRFVKFVFFLSCECLKSLRMQICSQSCFSVSWLLKIMHLCFQFSSRFVFVSLSAFFATFDVTIWLHTNSRLKYSWKDNHRNCCEFKIPKKMFCVCLLHS